MNTNLPDELLSVLTSNDNTLSRTAKSGAVATGISSRKSLPMVSGDALLKAIERNREAVVRYILERSPVAPHCGDELVPALLVIGYLTNKGIYPHTALRQWPYAYDGMSEAPIAPSDILGAMQSIGAAYSAALSNSEQSRRLAAVAGMEWDIGIGPLHPFYDGCGRISRSFAALLSCWLDVPIPRHRSREEYMAAATSGRASFLKYYSTIADQEHTNTGAAG